MKLVALLLLFVVCVELANATDKKSIDKLEATAKKIKTARIFYSNVEIKQKIKRSMEKDPVKWNQAREDYKQAVLELRRSGEAVHVPDTLDKVFMYDNSDTILLGLAKDLRKLHS